jgi:NAD(P)H dehydrogenase (quinone)
LYIQPSCREERDPMRTSETDTRILVTAAAGHTGSSAVRHLLNQGFAVRAFVRRDDDRAEALRQMGAEIFVGNLYDYRDLQQALTDVQRAYHCPPYAPNLLHGAMMFALAAEEAKLEVVALMSAWNPHPTHPGTLTREHWIANSIYRWMPSVGVIHINPGIFDFVYMMGLQAIAHFGLFAAPFGDGLNAPPSSDDIGELAAAVLANPAPHIGKSYRPTGPELLSPNDMAAIMGRVLGRKVTYKNVPFSMFAKAAATLGISTFEIAHLRHFAAELSADAFAVGAPTDHVQRILGRAPENFESVVRRYVAEPERITPGLKIGSKLSALAFTVRMLLRRTPNFDRWERERGHPLLVNPVLAHENPEWLDSASRGQLLTQSRTDNPAIGSRASTTRGRRVTQTQTTTQES